MAEARVEVDDRGVTAYCSCGCGNWVHVVHWQDGVETRYADVDVRVVAPRKTRKHGFEVLLTVEAAEAIRELLARAVPSGGGDGE